MSWSTGRVLAALLCGAMFPLGVTGCILQPEPKVVQGDPYPAPNAKTQEEHRDVGTPKGETAVSANALDVTLTQPTECRDQTPMVRDVTTERQANIWEQVGNATGAGLFGLIGGIALAAPCTNTPAATPSNPNPPSTPCTSDETQKQHTLGYVSLGIAGLSTAAFIYNVIKARDSKETVPVRVDHEWKACGMRPVSGAPLHLDLADGQKIAQATDARGNAHFDLATIPWNAAALEPGRANVVAENGQVLGTADLSRLPQYVAWQQERDRRQEEARNGQRRQGYAALVDRSEQVLTQIEGTLTAMERMPEPRTLPLAERVRDLVQQVGESGNQAGALGTRIKSDWAEFLNACQASCRRQAASSCGPESPQVIACVKPDPTWLPRLKAVDTRAQRVQARLAALGPRINRAAAIIRRQNDAQAAAFLQAWGNSSNASFSAPSAPAATGPSAADLHDMEARHQQERAEDERRHQQERSNEQQARAEDARRQREQDESRRNTAVRDCNGRCDQQSFTCSNRCGDTENSCRNSCPNGGSAWVTCKDGCHDTGNRCRQQCIDDVRPCKDGCR